MSNSDRLAKVLGAAAAAILLGGGLAIANITFTSVSVTGWPITPGSGGEFKCIGGTLTGTWPPCTPGSRVQVRGRNSTYRQVSPDPLHMGFRYIVFNANFDENGRGNMWGTWRVVLDGGRGEWEGTFTGRVFGWFGAAEGNVVGHGTEGEVDGMELRLVLAYDTFPGLETDSGYRFDPKGNQ